MTVKYKKRQDPNNELIYKVNLKDKKLGPVIGILVHLNSEQKLVVNESFVTSLARKLVENKMIPVLVPIQNIENDMIEGAIFHPTSKRWIKGCIPLPDCLFNRVSTRYIEDSLIFKNAVSFITQKGIPFFNPHFLDKFDTYQLLKANSYLEKFLPETIEIKEKQALQRFCKKWRTIYLKPRKKFKGNGILIMKVVSGGKISLKDYQKKWVFHDFEQFWKIRGHSLIQKFYLAQQAIFPAKIDGRRYDFRVLSHYKDDHYKIIGVGVRMAGPHNLTTHIPRGGKLIPYKLLKSQSLENQINQIINHIGFILSRHYGFFGEFSVDIGVSKKQELKIFEVNSKPMVFDEIHIENERLDHLCQLFQKMSIF